MTGNDITMVGYRPELRPEFERLNRLWLEGHSLLEPVDLIYLQEPEQHILAAGGQVFFAMDGEAVVGVCAAIRVSATSFELAKLAYAREHGAGEVLLTSHTALVEAIALYESMGFRHAPLPEDNRYETANVYMRLAL
jgi:putative acetyltransferase